MQYQALRPLLTLMSLVLFLPLCSIYFYRALFEDRKRTAKVMKGLNFIYFAIIVSHSVFTNVDLVQLALFLIIGLFLLATMEIAYHIDVVEDMVDLAREQLRRCRSD